MTLKELFGTRYLGAKMGLIAAAAVSVFIVSQLVDAARPLPTTLRVINAGADPVHLTRLTLATHVVDPGSVRLPGSTAGMPQPLWDSSQVELEPGFALQVSARLDGSGKPLSCALDPRPQGRCMVKVTLKDVASPVCEYECKPMASQ